MFAGFGNHLIHLVGYIDGANKICKAVDLCIGPGYSRLLGGQKCTFGPTYWCHTTLHAQACKVSRTKLNQCTKPFNDCFLFYLFFVGHRLLQEQSLESYRLFEISFILYFK